MSRPRVERGADGPPEHEEPTKCTFGDLLIGAKFWFKDEEYIKLSVDVARRGKGWALSHYVRFDDDDIVDNVT